MNAIDYVFIVRIARPAPANEYVFDAEGFAAFLEKLARDVRKGCRLYLLGIEKVRVSVALETHQHLREQIESLTGGMPDG